MAIYKLSDIAPIAQGAVPKQEQYWLLNLDAVESNTGKVLYYHFVDKNDVGASTIAFDSSNVLYSKLRPYLNKVVLPKLAGYATSEMLPLRPNKELITREFLTYFLRSPRFVRYINEKTSGAKMPRVNSSDLKAVTIDCPPIPVQNKATDTFERIQRIIDARQQELLTIDDLIKARFVEMFGEPISNSQNLPTKRLGEICELQAGDFTPADAIHEKPDESYCYPCYGGNGIRGYVDNYTQEGFFPIIGRQGALCGNVQLAHGKFRNTEHAVLVTPKTQLNVVWLFELLRLENLYRFHTGAAQPGLAVKTLNQVDVPFASIQLQKQYAEFFAQIDKSKFAVQKSLEETQKLFDSLMQQYFG